MRRLLVVLILAGAALSVLPPAIGATNGVLVGDVNCDQTVNSIDARDILKFHAGLTTELPCSQNSDVDGHAVVTSIDALLVLKYHAGLINHLPPIETFTGVIVRYSANLEGGCLALDTGSGVFGIWNPAETRDGDRVRVVGFLDPKRFLLCGLSPVINASSIEVLE